MHSYTQSEDLSDSGGGYGVISWPRILRYSHQCVKITRNKL